MVCYFFPDFTKKSGHVFSEICTFPISPSFTKALGCVQECRNLPELLSRFLIVRARGDNCPELMLPDSTSRLTAYALEAGCPRYGHKIVAKSFLKQDLLTNVINYS